MQINFNDVLEKKKRKASYKQPPTQISYLEDLLKEVYRRHKIKYDFDQSLDAVKKMFEFIVQETKNPEVFAIDIPYVGHLYKNKKYLINSKKIYNRNSEEYAIILDQIQQIKRFADECPGITPHVKKPFCWSFEKYITSKYEITEACRRMYKPNYDIYAAVEEIQNKDYKRITGNN